MENHMAKRVIVMFLLASGLLAARPAAAAGVLYLQIPGVSGPVTTAGFTGAIEVLSFSMGVQAPGTAPTGKRAGEICSDLAVQKLVDQTSPILFQHTAFGFFYKNVTLTFSEPQGDKAAHVVYRLVLNNAAIQSVEEGGSNEVPSESVSFKASSWTVTYFPTLSTGQTGSPVTTTVTCQ
jgi:type VI secretion system secreted protein Hcp